MKVLIACEFSGVVREAFRKKGHEAWSCDLLPAKDGSPYHYQKDIRKVIHDGWDLMIAHPPCTHLAVSGAAWFKHKEKEQKEALMFARLLMNYPLIPKIAVENPISIISTRIKKPDQIIHPWMFGHKEMKATCLWLKGLPKLVPTKDVKEEMLKLPKKDRMRVHYMSPSKDRGYLRSITYQGIADAMADQWG